MTEEEHVSGDGDGSGGDDKPKSKGAFWKELAILVVIAVVVSVVVRTFLLQTFWIPSGSMEHTLEIQDRVLVNKVLYNFRDPRRGEIIVFAAPAAWRTLSPEEEYIKRVIAVAGDRVVCCDTSGRIMINGTSLDEDYVHADGGISDPPSRNAFDIVVPDGRLWVMGDHRSASADSRENFCGFAAGSTGDDWVSAAVEHATIPIDSVVGRAFVLFWPANRFTWLTVPHTFDNVAPPGSDTSEPLAPAAQCLTPASLR